MNVVSSQTSPSQALASDSTKSEALSFYYLLFFLSGFPALLYQIVLRVLRSVTYCYVA